MPWIIVNKILTDAVHWMTSRHLSLPVSKRNHSPAPLSEQSCLSSSSSSASCGAVKWIKWGIRVSIFQKQELQLLSFISNCFKLHFHCYKIFAVHMNCTTHVISKSTCTLVALIAMSIWVFILGKKSTHRDQRYFESIHFWPNIFWNHDSK